MGVLWTSDFESGAVGDSVSGWANINGTWTIVSRNPAGGTKNFGPNPATQDAYAVFTGISAQTDMGMKSSQKIVSAANDLLLCQVLRTSADGVSGYLVQPYNFMGTLWIGVARRSGSTWTQIGSFVQNVLTYANNDILHVRSKLVGQTLSVYAWKNSDAEPSTASASFSMGGYVTAAGYGGLWTPQPNATEVNIGVDNVSILDNVTPATALSFTTAPTSGNANAASTNFVVTANGGISSTLTITPSDSGVGGSFSPATPTIAAGQTTASFTYTPTTSGSRSISLTNNGGLTNPTAVTYNSVGATTLQFTSAPTTGGINMPSTSFSVGVVSGGIVGNILITPSDNGGGGSFSPTSVTMNAATPSVSFTYTATSNGAKTISITNDGGLTNPANVTYTASGATAVTFTGPTSGSVGVASTVFTVGADGSINGTVRVTPDSSGGGTFSPTFIDINNSTPTGTFTYTPASTGAKTLSVTNNGSLSNPSSITYSATSASALLFNTAPSSGYVSVASSNFIVAANDVLLSTVRVTPNDNAGGGTFSPAFVDINSGSPTGTFTYTPASAGVKSIGLTNNGGLSNPASVSYTANTPPLTVNLNDSMLVWSVGNWDTLSPGTFGVGLLSKQSTCSGAYLRFRFTGATSLDITFDEAGLSPLNMKLKCVLNGSVSYVTLTTSTATVNIGGTLSSGTTYDFLLQIIASPETATNGRWNSVGASPVSVCRINAITLNSGNLLSPAVFTDKFVFAGDSISEGALAVTGAFSFPADRSLPYSVFTAEALGVEYGCMGYGGQGWVAAGNGSVPNFVTAWKYHTSGRLRDFSGLKAFVINMGTNDTAAVSLSSFLPDIRSTLGAGVWVLIVIPFGGYKKAEITSSVNAYNVSTGDQYVRLIDISTRLPPNAFLSGYLTNDTIHPNTLGHALCGSILADEVRKIVYPQNIMGGSSAPMFSNRFNRGLR